MQMNHTRSSFWNTAKWLFFASAWGLSASFSYAVITKRIKRI